VLETPPECEPETARADFEEGHSLNREDNVRSAVSSSPSHRKGYVLGTQVRGETAPLRRPRALALDRRGQPSCQGPPATRQGPRQDQPQLMFKSSRLYINTLQCTIDENLHPYSCTFNRMFSSLLFKFSDKAYLFELLSVRCVRHRSARVPFPFLRRVNVDCER